MLADLQMRGALEDCDWLPGALLRRLIGSCVMARKAMTPPRCVYRDVTRRKLDKNAAVPNGDLLTRDARGQFNEIVVL